MGCDKFCFSYRDVTDEALEKALHKNEVETSSKNHLYIDYKMRGLGSHSCGPEPEKEFEFLPHRFDFAFVMGACLNTEELLMLKRMSYGVATKAYSDEYQKQDEGELQLL